MDHPYQDLFLSSSFESCTYYISGPAPPHGLTRIVASHTNRLDKELQNSYHSSSTKYLKNDYMCVISTIVKLAEVFELLSHWGLRRYEI